MTASLPLSAGSARHPSCFSRDLPEGADARIPERLLARPVLVVEDEVMIAWTLESLLGDMGFSSVVIASSGAEAVAEAARLRPALVVSDINLGAGVMDGVDASAAIRSETGALVVFVSGYAGPRELGRIGLSVPGAPVVRKPVEFGEFRRVLASVAARTPRD